MAFRRAAMKRTCRWVARKALWLKSLSLRRRLGSAQREELSFLSRSYPSLSTSVVASQTWEWNAMRGESNIIIYVFSRPGFPRNVSRHRLLLCRASPVFLSFVRFQSLFLGLYGAPLVPRPENIRLYRINMLMPLGGDHGRSRATCKFAVNVSPCRSA